MNEQAKIARKLISDNIGLYLTVWAGEEGFEKWLEDNSAVLRNFSKWFKREIEEEGDI